MVNPIMKMVYREMKEYCNYNSPFDLEDNKRFEINIFKLLIIKFRCKNVLRRGESKLKYNERKKQYLRSFIRDRFEDTYDMQHLIAIGTIFDFVRYDYEMKMDTILKNILSIIDDDEDKETNKTTNR